MSAATNTSMLRLVLRQAYEDDLTLSEALETLDIDYDLEIAWQIWESFFDD